MFTVRFSHGCVCLINIDSAVGTPWPIAMSHAAVFILVLDSFTGFDSVLNETIQNLLQTTKRSQQIPANIGKCDALSVKSIMNIIDKTNHTKDLNETDQIDINSLLNPNKTIEKELQNFIDNDKDFFSKDVGNGNEGSSEIAPYLAAIFESLSNVTAQTCAGTALASRWLLTAAACVDVLPQLYDTPNVHSNQGNHSRYTIIANASNPLVDGTVHDVVEVILKHPSQGDSNKKLFQHLKIVDNNPSVALMRINTDMRVRPLALIKGNVEGVVTVYGWRLLKNGTGHDAMSAASFSAHVTEPARCTADTTIFISDIICLAADNHSDPHLNQISSGGPVITSYEGAIHILAVVQTIHNFLVTASPVSKFNGLDNIIYNN